MNATLIATSLAVTTLIQYLIYGGAILLVVVGVMIWAVAFRKPRKHRRHHHRRSRFSSRDKSSGFKGEADDGSDPVENRRRSETRRNPTLAETRGLPPLRGEQSGRYQP